MSAKSLRGQGLGMGWDIKIRPKSQSMYYVQSNSILNPEYCIQLQLVQDLNHQ